MWTTTRRYPHTPVRVAISKTSTNSKFGDRVEQREPSYKVLWMWLGNRNSGEHSEVLSKRLNKSRAGIWFSHPTPGCTRGENWISKDTCTPTFSAALLTTPQEWKPPQCPSLDEQEMMWHMYTMEYYSAIRKERWWRTAKPGVLKSIESQRSDTTEQLNNHKKGWNDTNGRHLDGPRHDHTEWSNLDWER